MRKLLCKSFRSAGQYSTEKLNFNRDYSFRQKATHPSVIQGKKWCMYLQNSNNKTNRINTELVNSQTFHNNRMADDKYPSFTFTGPEKENIISQLNKFELIAARNNQTEEIQDFRCHCTWKNLHSFITDYYQNKQKRASNS